MSWSKAHNGRCHQHQTVFSVLSISISVKGHASKKLSLLSRPWPIQNQSLKGAVYGNGQDQLSSEDSHHGLVVMLNSSMPWVLEIWPSEDSNLQKVLVVDTSPSYFKAMKSCLRSWTQCIKWESAKVKLNTHLPLHFLCSCVLWF